MNAGVALAFTMGAIAPISSNPTLSNSYVEQSKMAQMAPHLSPHYGFAAATDCDYGHCISASCQ